MKKSFKIILTILMFLAGFALRMVDFDDPPLDFHPARQMHSALLARGFYLQDGGRMDDRTPEYISEAKILGGLEAWIEPPIYEKLTAGLYHLLGTVDLRIPRFTSILFWLIGAIGLALLTDELLGTVGMFGALGWYLFFPYGVIASRSFQPDIIMTGLLIWTMYILRHWIEKPDSLKRALAAGLCAGLCILIKQVAAFPLGLAMAAGLISGSSLIKTLKNWRVWLAAVLALAPMLVYNYWGYFVKGFLVQQYQGRFFISELADPTFYVRWLRMIDQVFTIPLFFCGVFGILMIREKSTRTAFLAYFAGYILYGLSLPHHIGTHNYYQLLIFPFIALGLGSLVKSSARAVMKASRKQSRFVPVFAVLCGVLLCGWWAADSIMTMHRTDYRAWPERWETWMPELEPFAGRISTIGIMDDYGGGMIYWGLRNPGIWDTSVEGLDDLDALIKLNTTFWNYKYLVVTNLNKFYEQPRLQRYLNETAEIRRQEPDYIIYELNIRNEEES
ncbi:MAG: glycosyltransferase family 39 protein [Anaerolineaceae bacterium]|nr:glycosyltransferase family 39 protein [Anaerolineaceae bacterium]